MYIKHLTKKLDGNYTRMLRTVSSKSKNQYPTRQHMNARLPPISQTIQVKRIRHPGHCWRSKDITHKRRSPVDTYLHMNKPVGLQSKNLDSPVLYELWMPSRGFIKNESKESMLSAHFHDDNYYVSF